MTTLINDICENLGVKSVTPFGGVDRGCISAGRSFETENGPIFVKINGKHGAETMFRGEYASLRAIMATNAIKCPKPLGFFSTKSGDWALVMEYIKMGGSRDEKKLARSLANMHLANSLRLDSEAKSSNFLGNKEDIPDECHPTSRFGFPIDTCCGFIHQPNEWSERWDEFFIRNRLQFQVDLLIEKGDREILDVWPDLQLKATELLKDSSNVIPGLVHGDLWSGNWSYSLEEPIIFDPASFYADPEYEQGIINMFGGLSYSFWNEYHKVIPLQPGREKRVLLYELFHHLNHWRVHIFESQLCLYRNHFGRSYKMSSLNLIHKILNV